MIPQFHYFVSLLVLILGLWHEEANKELLFFVHYNKHNCLQYMIYSFQLVKSSAANKIPDCIQRSPKLLYVPPGTRPVAVTVNCKGIVYWFFLNLITNSACMQLNLWTGCGNSGCFK